MADVAPVAGDQRQALRITGASTLLQEIQRNIISILGNDYLPPKKRAYYQGLAYSVRDRLIERWLTTQRSFYNARAKRIYYLSLEFLPGRFLMNNILNLGLAAECRQALVAAGFALEDLEEQEWDAGLGNGGLGRLASCFLDSIASLKISGYGYGLRYDYGIFFQTLVNGWQVEQSDNWQRFGSPWEIKRQGYLYEVKFYGRSEPYTDSGGKLRYRWVDSDNIMAMACDIFIAGYGNDNVVNMRLWESVSSREFNLEYFNRGDYIGAVEAKVISENISKVLYPNDELRQGKELRLKQQYFFVSATFQDIMRRFKKRGVPFRQLPELVAVQLNDTHPAISIPELMRLLMDEEGLGWDEAWSICRQTFAYTNHTVLPEALETWPVELLGRVLPRHLEIIYEINQRFMQTVASQFPDEPELLARVSLIHEGDTRLVRMAHLAIVGSHAVNGVAALHTRILKTRVFRDFERIFPGRIINITNGITPRRWLLQANPVLAELISRHIGQGWVCDLTQLKRLEPLADDPEFRAAWRKVKRTNKKLLARYVLRKTGQGIDPDTLFDVHVKRMHEYKRQLLNILHVITLYNRIRTEPEATITPRTCIFGGKAAPGYRQAKLIIKLITSVAETINADPLAAYRLKVVFLPNYCVSQAEKLVPAADLSEQISTAGYEASGTGNMKFALNGALTIGTLDGANVEIQEEVGAENIFIFGLTSEEVEQWRQRGYDPREICNRDAELKRALDMIGSGFFAPGEPGLFAPILDDLLSHGDRYMVLADFRAFVDTQQRVARLYTDPEQWTRRSILNTARMGMFSSDRAILEYAQKIWKTEPLA
jgi:starch phosphorylase